MGSEVKKDCSRCLNSRPIVSENGVHAGCTLPPIDAVHCMIGREDNFVEIRRKEHG